MSETATAAPKTTSEPDAPAKISPAGDDRIVVTAPATGEEIGSVEKTPPEQVAAIITRARAAQEPWGELRVKERCRRVKRFHQAIADRLDDFVTLLVRENGKSHHDAVGEATATLSATSYFLMRGPKILKDRKIDAMGTLLYRARTIYAPRGVIGLIAPWNYPFIIPLYEAFAAWIAGNAVVVKPSEWTPLVAQLAKDVWDETGLPQDLFQVVHGHGDVGVAMIEGGIDKIHFTGSVRVGKLVGRACGERLIPCTLELGGKAPVIVTEDAPLERTARTIVWGKFFNSGQTCIGVERVYAVGSIAEPLTKRIVELTRELRQGDGRERDVDVGAMVFPKQIEVCEAQVADATSKGAAVLTGGHRPDGPGRFFEPTVIAGTDHGMAVMKEETFGPLLPIMAVATEDEAVRLANDSHLGLNAYVFSGSARRADRLARRVRAGSILMNEVVVNYGIGGMPFGGVKESGLGRSHGEEGLRSMTEPRMIARPHVWSWPVTRLLGYPYTEKKTGWNLRVTRWLFGSKKRRGESASPSES